MVRLVFFDEINLFLNLQMSNDFFNFSAPYLDLLDDVKLYFHLSLIFLLLPSKIGTVKKNKNIAKKIVDNSEPAPSKKRKYCVKLNHLWCNKSKFIQKPQKGEGFVLCTVCGSNFSVAHGGESNINRHKDTSTHRGYVDAAH